MSDRAGTPAPLPFYFQAMLHCYGAAIAAAAPDAFNAETNSLAYVTQQRLTQLDIAAAAARRMRQTLDGIEAWRAHPHRRSGSTHQIIWQSGSASLLDYGAQNTNAPTVLIIPSLINRAYILDLDTDTSFVMMLRQAVMRRVLLDWGDVGQDEAGFDLDMFLQARAAPAARFLINQTGRPISLLGYCMGGTLAIGLAHDLGFNVNRLGLIGAPWSFATLTGNAAMLRQALMQGGPERFRSEIQKMGAFLGAVPADLFQLLFALLAPMQAARKFSGFAPNGPKAKKFVAVEQWLSDAVDMPAPAAGQLLIDWYHLDQTGAGNWSPFHRPVQLEEIMCPSLLITGSRDHIATAAMTTPLSTGLAHCQTARFDTGHVGLVVGRNAHAETAYRLSTFFLED